MTRTFLDAGVLIAAARGGDAIAQRALDIIKDRERVFVSSPFVRLEMIAHYTEPFTLLVAQLAYEGDADPQLAYRFERFGT